MSRYIDADALLAELQEEIDFETSMYTAEQNNYFNMGLKCAFRDVKSQPTADVVEVRHGEWITKCIASSSSGFEWYMHTCSNCGDFYKTVLPNGYKYCHNCGAKMDGERRAEE